MENNPIATSAPRRNHFNKPAFTVESKRDVLVRVLKDSRSRHYRTFPSSHNVFIIELRMSQMNPFVDDHSSHKDSFCIA